MQKVLSLIEQRKQEFAKLPLFGYMEDKRVAPSQRLAFAPCMAHYVMSFSDLNKYVFREKEEISLVQKIINKHTNEDDEHWSWYIQDMYKLGLNSNGNLTKALEFIWGEETKITRQITYIVAGCVLNADPIIKIAAVEALEAMGHIFCSVSAQLALELEALTGKEYEYFGHIHLDAETGHAVGTPEAEDFLRQIELTDSQHEQALDVVNKIFQIFTDWTYELLTYAQKHPVEPVISKEASTALALCV